MKNVIYNLTFMTHYLRYKGGGMFTHLGVPKVCSDTKEVEFDYEHILNLNVL